MIKNRLVIMPFSLPWDWSADYQRQTSLVLAKHNLVVCYMHRQAHFFLKHRRHRYPKIRNIHFYSPGYLLPFRRFPLVEKLNQVLCLCYLVWRYGRGKQIILWLFDPDFYFYPVIGHLFKRIISLYDCVDYHASRVPQENKIIRTNEVRLIRNSDRFFVNSQTLYAKHKTIREARLVPLGFSLSEFVKPNHWFKPIRLPQGKPIIGYIGSLNYRLDWPLLLALVRRHPQWTFVFLGEIQTSNATDQPVKLKLEKLLKQRNVFYGGPFDRTRLPGAIAQFAVGIIPYDLTFKLNRYCFPLKLLEYFYLGKPVVATPIEELKRFPRYVCLGKGLLEWEKCLTQLFKTPWPLKVKASQKRLAQKNSWENKIKTIGDSLG